LNCAQHRRFLKELDFILVYLLLILCESPVYHVYKNNLDCVLPYKTCFYLPTSHYFYISLLTNFLLLSINSFCYALNMGWDNSNEHNNLSWKMATQRFVNSKCQTWLNYRHATYLPPLHTSVEQSRIRPFVGRVLKFSFLLADFSVPNQRMNRNVIIVRLSIKESASKSKYNNI
jgi:hypothetical protein